MFTGMTPLYLVALLSLLAHAFAAVRHGLRGAVWCMCAGFLGLFLIWASIAISAVLKPDAEWAQYRFAVFASIPILLFVIGAPMAVGGVLGGALGALVHKRAAVRT